MNKIATSLSPAFLIVFSIFVFGPSMIYQGNLDEFLVPLGSLLKSFVLPALVLFLLLGLIGLALPRKAHRFYVSILFALGVLLWLQGNLLVWRYGLLDGQGIDWTRGLWRGWVDGILWVALLVLAGFFSGKIYRVVGPGSLAIAALLLVSLLITSVQKPGIWAGQEKPLRHLIPPEEIFEFSSGQNIIHFVLDGFQSDLFDEIVTADPDRYFHSLEGFTFFKEASGEFPTTYMSIPAFLTGRIYKNDVPMREFLNRAMRGRTIARWLHGRGYRTDLVADTAFTKAGKQAARYHIAVPYGGSLKQYLKLNSTFLLNLVLFRQAPHFLKKYVYNNERWLFQGGLDPEARHLGIRYFSHQAFLSDLIRNMSVKGAEPVYKYVHLMTTHPPVVVGRDCRYAPVAEAGREDIKTQDKCSLDHFIEFLDRLREKGLYDSSLIIVQADHGLNIKVKMRDGDDQGGEGLPFKDVSLDEIASSAAPLMAVKPPFSRGPMKISRAQVSLTDIPATIGSVLKLKRPPAGRSAYYVGEEEVRERRFYYYHWRNENWESTYFPRLDEFIIKGSLFDRNSWQWSATFYPPTRADH